MDISTIITFEHPKPDVIIAIALLKIINNAEVIIVSHTDCFNFKKYQNNNTIFIGMGDIFDSISSIDITYSNNYDVNLSHAGVVWKDYQIDIIKQIYDENFKDEYFNIIDQMNIISEYIYSKLIYDIDLYDITNNNHDYKGNMNLLSLINSLNPKINTIKELLYDCILSLIQQYIKYSDDINYIKNLIGNNTNKYLTFDIPCMYLSEVIDFLDPNFKYKFFVFVGEPNSVLIRHRFNNISFHLDKVKKTILSDDIIFINEDRGEIKVKNITTAINIIDILLDDIHIEVPDISGIDVNTSESIITNNNDNNNMYKYILFGGIMGLFTGIIYSMSTKKKENEI